MGKSSKSPLSSKATPAQPLPWTQWTNRGNSSNAWNSMTLPGKTWLLSAKRSWQSKPSVLVGLLA
jgi:hypothetical protein